MWYLLLFLIILGGILLARTIKVPKKEEKRIETLEVENADLWFENMVLNSKVTAAEQEIADLWFEIISGGIQ